MNRILNSLYLDESQLSVLNVWQECLLGVLSSKTVVYVTHQVEFLPTADLILVSIYHNCIIIYLKEGFSFNCFLTLVVCRS